MSSPRPILSVCIACAELPAGFAKWEWKNGQFEIEVLAKDDPGKPFRLHSMRYDEARSLYTELVEELKRFRPPLRVVAGGAS